MLSAYHYTLSIITQKCLPIRSGFAYVSLTPKNLQYLYCNLLPSLLLIYPRCKQAYLPSVDVLAVELTSLNAEKMLQILRALPRHPLNNIECNLLETAFLLRILCYQLIMRTPTSHSRYTEFFQLPFCRRAGTCV